MAGPRHFDAQAELYAAARPPYPDVLWARLAELGLLVPGHRVVDLGAGTGQATGPLLAAGLEVTAVEPGVQLARLLSAAHPAATVVVARAEDAQLGRRAYDLVVAATSIHWLDLEVVLPKVHGLLRSGGHLVVWRHVFGDADAPSTPFRERVAEIVAARTTPPRPGPDAEDPAATLLGLTDGGLFVAEATDTFRWTIELDDTEVHRLFSTFSDWTPDEVQQAAAAVRAVGGRVVEQYQTWLIVLSREGH